MLRERHRTRTDGTYCACEASAMKRRAAANSSSPDSSAMAATAVCVAVPAWQVQLAYSFTERGCTTLLRLGKAAASLAPHSIKDIAAILVLYATKVASYELRSSRQKVFVRVRKCMSSGSLGGCNEYLPQVQLVADSSMRL